MSKNIAIQEGGIAKTMNNVKKLQTAVSGGGTCYWVPEDETKVTTRHITKNGTYKASEEDVYGFSEVYVNVPGDSGGTEPGGPGASVVGTDPDTGNEEVVTVDEDGYITTEPIPSSIAIVSLPAKTSYASGESIDISGMVVTAKNADGTTWTNSDYPSGQIPLGELKVIPKAASASTSGDGTFEVNTEYYVYEEGAILGTISDRTYTKICNGPAAAAIIKNYSKGSPATFFLASTDRESAVYTPNGGAETHVRDETTVYITFNYGFWNNPPYTANVPVIDFGGVYPSTRNELVRSILDKMNFIIGGSSGGGSTVTIKWERPKDGKILSNNFQIEVTSSNNSNQSGSFTENGEEFSGSTGNY